MASNKPSVLYQQGQDLGRLFLEQATAFAPTEAPPEARHPWVVTTEMARQGLTPEGRPIGEAAREGLAFGLRTAPAAVPAPVLSAPLSAAGEAAAQLVESGTITSPVEIGVAAALPSAVRYAGRGAIAGAKAVAKRLPGAAPVLQEEAIAAARAIPERFRAADPAGRAERLFDQLAKLNPRIPSDNLRQAVNELLLTERQLPPSLQGQVRPVLEGLTELLNEHGDQIPFQTVRHMLRRIGQRTGSVQGLEANEVRGAFKHLSAAIQRDLEAAAQAGGKQGTAATLLRQANEAFARAKAIDELAEAIEGAINKGRADLRQSFNPARALNELAESPNFPRAFSPKELEEIGTLLRRFRGLPSLPPPGGEAAIGSGRVLTRLLVGSGLGSAAGMGLGGPVGSVLGAAVGPVAATAVSQSIAHLLSTPGGRKFLTRILDASGGVITDSVVPVLMRAAQVSTLGQSAGLSEASDR